MRTTFRLAAAALLLALIVQVFLAGLGAFDAGPREEGFAPHRALGYLLIAAALLVTVLGAVARVPARQLGLAAVATGLLILQPVLASAADAFGESAGPGGTLVGGVHAATSLGIVAAMAAVVRRTREVRPPQEPPLADVPSRSEP